MHLIDPQLIPKHCLCARRNFKAALLVFNIIFYTKGQRAPSTCLYILILKDGEKEKGQVFALIEVKHGRLLSLSVRGHASTHPRPELEVWETSPDDPWKHK